MWPIPLVGMVALPFAVFPTLLMYVGGAVAVYLVLALSARIAFGRIHYSIQIAALGLGVGSAFATGWVAARSWNRAAGVDDGNIAEVQRWRPLGLARGGSLALVSGPFADIDPCDAGCLALLVTGRVQTVVVASPSRWPIRASDAVNAKFIRLKPNWQACLGKLTDYNGIVRSFAASRLDHFREYGLEPTFAGMLPGCLEIVDMPFKISAQPVLAYWRYDSEGESNRSDQVGLDDATITHWILLGNEVRVRRQRTGRRYAEPAILNPYAGNAATGGYFSLSWGIERFETLALPDGSNATWWSMLSDGDELVVEAAKLLDRVVPDKRPDYGSGHP